MEQGRKLNRVAVKEEHQRLNQPGYEARLRAQERKEAGEKWRKEMQAKGLTEDEAYLLETAEAAARKEEAKRKKDKNKAAFGWDVFNQDAKYKVAS